MEEIKEWAAMLCCAAVFGAALRLIAPSGSYERIIRLAAAAFTVCVVFTPLSYIGNIKLKFDLSDTQKRENSSNFESTLISQAESLVTAAAKRAIESILEENGVPEYNIEIFTNTSDSGGISIERVQVFVKAGTAAPEALEREISARTGINAEVIIKKE